jgi:sulfur carrier protein
MQIFFNGAEKTVPDQSTVQELLTDLDILPNRIIFVCNDTIVPPEEYACRTLCEQDRLDVLNIVGGG